MKEDINDINDLLGKYLASEASEQERVQAEEWIAASNDNQAYFNQLKLIFERAATVKETQVFDADKAWMLMKSKLAKSKTRTITFQQFRVALRMAAILVIAFGLGFISYQWLSKNTESTSLVSTETILRDSLPDGTITVLNKESKIQYTATRWERKVVLEGEAFFQIKPNEDKQFIVEANGVTIEDIGTAFNVKSNKGSSTVEVYVQSGEVSLYTKTSEHYTIKAGGAGVFDNNTKLFKTIGKIDTNRLAYKTGIFNFRNVKLETILSDLNSVYDLKVKVKNPAINNCKLTVTFKNERIENIVAIIAESLNLIVTKDGVDYMLDGTGCEN